MRKLYPQKYCRRFELNTERILPHQAKLFRNVIEAIENDEIKVLDIRDIDILCQSTKKNGADNIFERFTVPVSIREWLSIACQELCVECDPGKAGMGFCAWYEHNIDEVIAPIPCVGTPVGPAGITGKIVIECETCASFNDAELMFCFAHELTHAFTALRVLVPAFQDWNTFWSDILADGGRCDIIHQLLHDMNLFPDQYGTDIELAMVEQHWPSNARTWYDAYRKGLQLRKSEDMYGLL